MNPRSRNVKVVLLGDGGVGKTSIVNSYFKKPFQGTYKMTLGTEFRIKRVGNHVIQIWDLAGQPIFSSVRSTYYVGALGAILAYDVTKKSTYDNIPNWLEEFYYHKGEKVPVVLVANKVDLRDTTKCLTAEDGLKLKDKLEETKKFEVTYVETSAKTNHNIDSIFNVMIEKIVPNDEVKVKIDPIDETKATIGAVEDTITKIKLLKETIAKIDPKKETPTKTDPVEEFSSKDPDNTT